jgi:hypothetical protein
MVIGVGMMLTGIMLAFVTGKPRFLAVTVTGEVIVIATMTFMTVTGVGGMET